MSNTTTRLGEIREQSFAALFHAPYYADGNQVTQANNHPEIRPYVLCSGPSSLDVSRSIAETLSAVPALLAAVQAVLDLHKWRCGDWKDHEDRAWYGDHCAECREEWPCDTATTITTALTEAKS